MGNAAVWWSGEVVFENKGSFKHGFKVIKVLIIKMFIAALLCFGVPRVIVYKESAVTFLSTRCKTRCMTPVTYSVPYSYSIHTAGRIHTAGGMIRVRPLGLG